MKATESNAVMILSKRVSALLITIVTSIVCSVVVVQAQARSLKPKFATVNERVLSAKAIASKVSRALVLIITQDEEGKPVTSGSGFFYDLRSPNRPHLPPGVLFADGDIATTLHVFKGASQGYVKMNGDGATYRITEIVAIDKKHDLCVFRAAGATAEPLTVESGIKPAVGEDIYVGGNPRGLEATISKGIVTALRLEAGLIQLDASISPGSSGGPVVNNRGHVIGIVTGSLTEGQNLNFAVEAKLLATLDLNLNITVSAAGALP